jgi:hypothetical protein
MSEWRKYNGALIPSLPPHVEVDTTDLEKRIRDGGVFFARWTTNFDCKKETAFWYVICDEKLEISDYSKNTRNQIRRGLRNCEVKIIDKKIVLEEGFESYTAAFLKYNTHLEAKSEDEFHQEIESLSNEYEFWGIYNKGNMIGYCQNKVVNFCCDYSTIKFHPDFLKLYPSYALFYTMNKYYLNEKNFKYVSDGARSISHKTNIQFFLIHKFKFRKAYCKLHIEYSLMLRFIVMFIYPLRFVFNRFNNKFAVKITTLLLQEKIRRSFL